jgi:hypothetical protein
MHTLMNTLRLRFVIFLAVASFLLPSCKKDKDAEPTNTDLVVANEWKGDRVLVNGIDVSNRPEIKSMLLDIKSTRLALRRDGTYTATYNQDGDPQTTNGNWTFKENETIIYFDLLGDLQIISLTSGTMNLYKTVTQSGTSFEAEVHFVK